MGIMVSHFNFSTLRCSLKRGKIIVKKYTYIYMYNIHMYVCMHMHTDTHAYIHTHTQGNLG